LIEPSAKKNRRTKQQSREAVYQDKRIEIFLPGNTAKLQGK
jgi:hypothetical protein